MLKFWPVVSKNADRLASIRGMPNLLNRARVIINLVFWALGLTYSWLLVRDIPYPDIINGSRPTFVLQVALFLLYWCWVFGLRMDLKTHGMVYISDPNRGKLPVAFYRHSLVMFLIALVLFYARTNDELFALALTLFSVAWLWALAAGRRGVRAIVDHSMTTYEENDDWLGKEKLEIVKHYVDGRWVSIRQIALIVILVGVDVTCWAHSVREGIAGWIHGLEPDLKEEAVAPLVPVASIVTFLVVAEGWQWYMRVKTRLSVTALHSLEGKYAIERR